jgi:uracil phosphoribosyltransferase
MFAVPFHLVSHPIALDALAELRHKNTPASAFRTTAHRISLVMVTEALRGIPSRQTQIVTPVGPAEGRVIDADIVLVPILRAGLGMLEAALQLVPRARVGHIGLRRDEETAVAARYYARLPEHIDNSEVVVLDPMLATGGSASAAIALLKRDGAKRVRLVCLVAAPEGVACLERAHPDVHVYAPALDSHLNDRKFIVPGLGDFGDRLYGTE